MAAVLVSISTAQSQDKGWGEIKGRVVWEPKEIPKQKPIEAVHNNADKNHCLAKGEVLSEEWIINPKNRGLRWTFVWLVAEDGNPKTPLPIHPKLKDVPTKPVEIDQPHCAFIPHVVALREGQPLLAKNSSPVSHNIKWTGINPANQGNVTLPAGKSYEIKLQVQRLPVTLECNIHPWMNGRAGVFTHPYFAITDADGNFSIKDAPSGNYRLVVYNGSYLGGAKGSRGRPITIPAGAAINLGDLEFSPPPPPK
jgi:hypothetical protein